MWDFGVIRTIGMPAGRPVAVMEFLGPLAQRHVDDKIQAFGAVSTR